MRRPGGFTLLETLLALAILGVLVTLLLASLRVGVAAWEGGEARAEAQQRLRAVTEHLTETLTSAYPYQVRPEGQQAAVVLFEGRPHEVRFVTAAPPLTLPGHIAFHAVTVAWSEGEGLTLTEKPLPAEAPFAEGARLVLDPQVSALRLSYRAESGAWRETWDGVEAKGLPTAVRIELAVRFRNRTAALPLLVVPLPLGKRA